MPRQVLTVTQITSGWWKHTGAEMMIEMSLHTGGIWTVQFESAHASGTWIDTDVTFDDVGQLVFRGSRDSKYRLHGGTVGAAAYILDATFGSHVESVVTE